MINKDMDRVQKMTFSAMVIALYVTVLYFTQSFSFGAYQIRIATALYALSYLFPFLVLPLGLANFIANMLFGGLVGIRKMQWNRWLMILPIVLVPGFGVSTWLSYLLELPYLPLAGSLCVGQAVPAVCGVLLVKVLERVTRKEGARAYTDARKERRE